MSVQSPTLQPFAETTGFQRWRLIIGARYQKFLDDSTRWLISRWAVTSTLLLLYILRVYFLGTIISILELFYQ